MFELIDMTTDDITKEKQKSEPTDVTLVCCI